MSANVLTERWAVKAWEGRAASAEVRVYLASEADARIAQLEAEVEQLKESLDAAYLYGFAAGKDAAMAKGAGS